MPTPLANATAWMQYDPQFPTLHDRYRQAMLDDVARMTAEIPCEKLAIQWDVCFEVVMAHGWMPMPAGIDREAIAAELVRISDAVPPEVELGYHFCFGDFEHAHVREPDDTAGIVELVASFIDQVERPVTWMHLPVPIERDDDAYFAPLRNLRASDGTELYLGLVHFRDGTDGAHRRIATARRHVESFGVATECGMGRRPPDRGGAEDTLTRLLATHAEVASPVHTRASPKSSNP